jgi:hypothetical protein
MERQPVPIAISPLTLMFANLTVILRPLSVFAGGMWAVRSDSDATGGSSTLS